MNDDPLIERLHRMAEDLPVQVADSAPVRRRARLRTVRSRAIGGLTVTILGLAVLVPLRSLSGLGGEQAAPQANAWTETYVLSDFEVQYPMLVSDVGPTEPVEDDTPLKPDPAMALVSFRSMWSGEVYPGEAECEIRLFDRGGVAVGHQSLGFATMEPTTRRPTSIEVEVDRGEPVSADGSCGPGVPPGPGTYLVSNLHVVEEDYGARLMGDVVWSTETPPLDQYCIASFDMPDGSRHDEPFTMAVGPAKDTTILLLPHGFVDATPLGVRCEPYNGHNSSNPTDASPTPTEVSAEAAWQETYRLSDFRVGPAPAGSAQGDEPVADGDAVGVMFDYDWTGVVYPGEAQCRIDVVGADGTTIGSAEVGLMSLMSHARTHAPMRVAIDAQAATAQGFCEPASRPTGDYRFSDIAIEGDTVTFTISWGSETAPGTGWCTSTAQLADGSRRSYHFTLTVGNPVQVADKHVPPNTVDFDITCEPYTNQAGDEATNADPPDGTDMSAAEKIPFIVQRIVDVQAKIAEIPEGSTDPTAIAQRQARERMLASLQEALDRLCGELDPAETVEGCRAATPLTRPALAAASRLWVSAGSS